MLLLREVRACYSTEWKIQWEPKQQPLCPSQVPFLENMAAPGLAVPFKTCPRNSLKAAVGWWQEDKIFYWVLTKQTPWQYFAIFIALLLLWDIHKIKVCIFTLLLVSQKEKSFKELPQVAVIRCWNHPQNSYWCADGRAGKAGESCQLKSGVH